MIHSHRILFPGPALGGLTYSVSPFPSFGDISEAVPAPWPPRGERTGLGSSPLFTAGPNLARAAGVGVMWESPSVTSACVTEPPHGNPAPQALPSLPCNALASSRIQGTREVSPVPQRRRGRREAVGQCRSCLVKHRQAHQRGGVSQ